MHNNILVVSNSLADVDSIKRALLAAHDGPYQVAWVDRLSSALERLKGADVDAILVDLLLPDCGGIETFDQLFAAAPQVPILTLSPEDDESLAQEAVQRGAQGYLTKGHFATYLVPQSLRNVIQRMGFERKHYVDKVRTEWTINSTADAVIGTDLLGNVDYMNLAAERMTGWPRDEARGRHINDVMPLINGETGEPMRNPLELVLEQNDSVELAHNTVVLGRGTRDTPIEDSTAPIHDAQGKMAGAVIVFHDVTDAQAMVKKMTHLAQHDVLTNLPNRALNMKP